MKLDVQISGTQLAFLMIGYLFGSAAILDPVSFARQDAWLGFLLGWAGGALLFVLYVWLSRLNPEKTLVEILRANLGKYVGTVVALLYLLYLLQLAALVIRKFGGYMVTANYPETPLVFVIAALAVVAAYAVRNGLEVTARASELVVPMLMVLTIILFFALIPLYNLQHLQPTFEKGIHPVLYAGLVSMTFPFGEGVAFLMIFPFVHKKAPLLKTVLMAIFLSGVVLYSITMRDLLSLGPDLFDRTVFPPEVATKLIPGYDVDPFVAVNMVIGGGIQFSVCLYAVVYGLAQLFKLDDYKPLVLPVVGIVVPLAIWLFDNLIYMIPWFYDVWPYYSLPFQLFIPLLLIGISLFRKRFHTA